MRTLVVSDLHLGARLRRDVLRRREPLQALLAALEGVDRLVLLGDVVELLEHRPAQAMEVAEPVLRAIGAGIQRGAEVIVVPGNHDSELVAPWLRTHGISAAVDAELPRDATALLAGVTSWLGPADVRVRYPGVWLSDRVWATHGHYLDRHLLPETAFGVARGLLGRLPRDGAAPVDYERAGGPSLTRLEALLTRWLPRPLAGLVDDLAELLRAATMPRVRRVPRGLMARRHVTAHGERAGRPDAPREHPGPGASGAPARRRGRLGPVRPRAPLRPARRRRPGRLARARRDARASSTAAAGSTSRCWSTTRARRTRTGRAERSSWTTGGTRARSGYWTTWTRRPCTSAARG